MSSEAAALRVRAGRIRRARWNPGSRTLELLLRLPAVAEWDEVLLRYRGVARLEPSLPQLARIVEDPATRLADHALEGGEGAWRHVLTTGAGEVVVVECGAVAMTRAPVAGPEAPLDEGHRFEVLSC